jgi:hypothetical protein
MGTWLVAGHNLRQAARPPGLNPDRAIRETYSKPEPTATTQSRPLAMLPRSGFVQPADYGVPVVLERESYTSVVLQR